MSTAADDLDALADEFAFLDDWEARYRHVIELGKAMPGLSAEERSADNLVKGCVSQAWLVAEMTPGEPKTLTVRGDSDAHIVRGLIAVLARLYSGRTLAEAAAFDAKAAFDRLGFSSQLTPQRANGLTAMIARLQADIAAAG